MGKISKKLQSKFIWYFLIFTILALALSNFIIISIIGAKSKYALSILLNNYFVNSNTINELINRLVTSPFVSHLTVLKDGVIYKDLTGLADSYNYILTKSFIGKNGIYEVKLFISLPDLVKYVYIKLFYLSFILTLLFDVFFLLFYRNIKNTFIRPIEVLLSNIKERKISKLISIKNKEFFEAQKELEDIFSVIRISQQKIHFISEILEVLSRSENFKEDFKHLLKKLVNSLPQIDGFLLVEKQNDDGLKVKVIDKHFEKEFKVDKESFSLYAFNLINPKLVPEVDKLGVLSEEEKEIFIKDAYVIPINLFSKKIGAFITYSKGKLFLSDIEKEFFKLLGFTIFLALVLDKVYKEAQNIDKLKAELLIKGILNYLNILENRYIYSYKTQRILSLIEKLKDTLNSLNLGLEKLKRAATLMDIGLFMMPDKIVLNFEEDLEEKEKNLYELHPIIGSIYINSLNACDEDIKRAILEHHENIDGSGFPSQKKGNEISSYAKVLRILDDFDSLSYKENKEKALEFLREQKGKYYDEEILDKLLPELEKIEIPKVSSLLPEEILELQREVLEIEKNSLNIALPKDLEKIEKEIEENNKDIEDNETQKTKESSQENLENPKDTQNP